MSLVPKGLLPSLFLAIVVCLPCANVEAQALERSGNTATASSPGKSKSKKLRSLLKESRLPGQFVQATEAELSLFETRLAETLKCQTLDEAAKLKPLWSGQNWELCLLPEYDGWMLVESQGYRTGRGIYFWRIQSEGNLVLQSPHRFFDMRTGTILSRLISEEWVSAAAWNTVHRKHVDVAHTASHHFNAFTKAVLQQRTDSLFLQLHGFAVKKKSDALNEVQMIVSNGTKFPNRPAWFAAEQFKQALGKEQVRLYPLETKRLGGTTNAQAKVIWAAKSSRFLHLEMNAELRQQILQTRKTRGQFVGVLSKLATKSLD